MGRVDIAAACEVLYAGRNFIAHPALTVSGDTAYEIGEAALFYNREALLQSTLLSGSAELVASLALGGEYLKYESCAIAPPPRRHRQTPDGW